MIVGFFLVFLNHVKVDLWFKEIFHAWEPSKSTVTIPKWKIRTGSKSKLISVLEKRITKQDNEPPQTDVMIIDGSALVNPRCPGGSKTFDEYAS